MTIEQMIEELQVLEEIGRSLTARCCKARKQLESVYSPAPKRGKKNALSIEQMAILKAGVIKSVLKNRKSA